MYTLGDRSNLTFSSGQLVYGSNGRAEDGSFRILIQPLDVAPPANWTSNWLPGPSGGGNISLLLRYYGATDALMNDSFWPVVTKQGAITAGSIGMSSLAGSLQECCFVPCFE